MSTIHGIEHETPASTPPSPGFGPWFDPGRRRKAAVASVFVVLALTMADVLWSAVGIAAVGGMVAVPTQGWFEEYDTATIVLAWVTACAMLVSGALFIRWQRLVIRNTAFLGCEKPDPSPALATVAWFIPVVSLILPIVSFRRIALWSRPPETADRRPLLMTWWIAWVLANILAALVTVLHQLAEEATIWITVTGADIGVSLLFIASGVLAAKVVSTLSRDQVDKAQSMSVLR